MNGILKTNRLISVYRQAVSSFLVLLFIYTAVNKLLHISNNKAVLSHLPFVGNYSAGIAVLIPLVELIVVTLFLLQSTQKLAFFCSLVLFIIFTGYLAVMVLSGHSLPCTCGGVLESFTWNQHIIFNIVLSILILIALRSKSPPRIHH